MIVSCNHNESKNAFRKERMFELESLNERPRVFNARDLCVILGMSLNNVYALMRSQGFPSIKVSPRRYVVPEDAFNRWMDEQVQAKKVGG